MTHAHTHTVTRAHTHAYGLEVAIFTLEFVFQKPVVIYSFTCVLFMN